MQPSKEELYRKTLPMELHLDRRQTGRHFLLPTLTVIEGKHLGLSMSLVPEKPSLTIGREEECDLAIPDESVSRKHARVWIEGGVEELRVNLEDLQSTNKTLLNGREIKIEPLKPGDKIFIGDTVLRFEMLDPMDIKFHEEILKKATASEIDPLTQLFSRRFLEQSLPKLYEELVKAREDFSLILLDIDHFKAINDRYLHAIGDEVLKLVAQFIRSSIRTTDLPIRYGGEEIVVALPYTPLEGALEIAERLRIRVATEYYGHLGRDLKVTISLGVTNRREGLELHDLVNLADIAMYQAKQAGRNQVHSITQRPTPKE